LYQGYLQRVGILFNQINFQSGLLFLTVEWVEKSRFKQEDYNANNEPAILLLILWINYLK